MPDLKRLFGQLLLRQTKPCGSALNLHVGDLKAVQGAPEKEQWNI